MDLSEDLRARFVTSAEKFQKQDEHTSTESNYKGNQQL